MMRAVLIGVLLMSQCPAIAGEAHPYKDDSSSEAYRIKAHQLVLKGRFDDAIINFQRASDKATNECETFFAANGLAAAEAAKQNFKAIGGNSNELATNASIREYWNKLQEGEKEAPEGCLV